MPWNSQNVTSLLIVNAAAGGFSGVFVYSPAAGTGNLIASIAATAGTDPYGNGYLAGVVSYAVTGDAQLLGNALAFTNATFGGNINFGGGSKITETSGTLQLTGTAGSNRVAVVTPVLAPVLAVEPGTSFTAESPHAPSLGAGWATGSATAGFQPIEYWATIDGLVELDGTFHSTSATPASTIWTFPSGWFNPTNAQRLPAVINNNAGAAVAAILSISTAGVVTIPLPAISAASEDVHVSARFRLSG